MAFHRKDLLVVSIIIVCWISLILLSDVRGNFPLNDDWSYAYSAKTFSEEGRIELTGWASMPIVTQIFWGSLFCSFGGFSFEALRLSTIVLSIIGIIFCYLIFNESTKRLYLKFVSTCLIAINPIYFLLSSTFMTDIPFFTLSLISTFLFLRFFKTENKYLFLIGFLFIVAASFIRQIGVLVLLSFALTYSLNKNNSLQKKIYLILSVLILILLLFLSQYLIKSAVDNPLVNNHRTDKLLDAFSIVNIFGLIPLLKNSVFALIYIGLFIFPFLTNHSFILIKKYSFTKSKFYLTIFTFSVIILIPLITFNKLLPLRPNILWKYGLGPATLKDVDILELSHIDQIPQTILILLTLAGIIGAVLIISTIFLHFKENKFKEQIYSDRPSVFIFITVCLTLIILCLSNFYDRYLLQMLPLVIFLVLKTYSKEIAARNHFAEKFSYLILALITLFTVYETQNYFSWNRCRWESIKYLTDDLKINADNIDGGFEFNGWIGYDPKYIPTESKSWWWVKDDAYLVSFGELENYTVIKKFEYHSFLKTKYLYALKREN
ncbi:MAG: glycosyltransferase family 39 protein [Ignavibacteria bacterium]|nr:glycosyltransferase family 39 protein [Ignavibacteria bacterium]